MGFTYALSDASDRGGGLAELQPVGAIDLARAQPAPPPPPPEPENPTVFFKFLEPEIKEGLVTVDENAQRILVRISGDGMFASGSDKLDPQFVPLMERIGKALQDQPGNAVITGHTDNVPIRKSLRFPSNYHLSVARAETAKAIIVAQLQDPSRITAEGRGENEPIADNSTAEGRKQNRRIELIVFKSEEAAAINEILGTQ
jgi:type VI secretion system protein ImpK